MRGGPELAGLGLGRAELEEALVELASIGVLSPSEHQPFRTAAPRP